MSADLNYALSRQGAPKFQFDTHFFDRLVDYMHVQFCDILFSNFEGYQNFWITHYMSHNLHELARVIYACSCKGLPKNVNHFSKDYVSYSITVADSHSADYINNF